MKKLALLLLFGAAPLVAGDLRLFNPGDDAAAATIACAGGMTASTLPPHAIADFTGDDCSAQSAAPLLVLRTGATNGIEWQLLSSSSPLPARGERVAPSASLRASSDRVRGAIHTTDTCPATAPLLMPLNGCRFGTAVAAVAPVDGASYSWSVDGGSILSGTGTERILIAIDGGATLRVTASVAKDNCTTTAAGVMALRDQFLIKSLDAGSGALGTPRTITWSYANGEPGTQVLSGTDFAEPLVLPPTARSYTFTPLTGGDRQIVLQASLATLIGHGRAVSSGGGGASSCGQARAQASYHIECIRPDATIVAPSSVGTGKPFTASVALAAGAKAEWTIVNGTPEKATGDSVTITPTGTKPVDLSVTITTNGGCSAAATAHIVVNQACDNPTATMYIARNDCDAAVVQARLTGTPPFRGTWENGQTFLTSDMVIDRPVSVSGTYAVQNFTDAVCGGGGSAVTINVKTASVALGAPNGFCVGPTTTATATFGGVPPFIGTWSDGVTFSTSSKTIQRSVTKGGPLSMTWSDATCSNKTSQALPFITTPTASLDFSLPPPSCIYQGYPIQLDLKITVTNGHPPYKVTWWDNKVQYANDAPIIRTIWTYESPNGAYAVKSVQDASCDAVITKPAVAVVIVPQFSIDRYNYFCPGATYSISAFGIPSGGTIAWRISNGTITAGQGTGRVTFVAGQSGTLVVAADLTFAGCTSTQSYERPIQGPPPAKVDVLPLTIPLGNTARMTIALTPYEISSFTVLSSTVDKPVSAGFDSSGHYVYTFTPTVKGDVTLTVRVKGYCGTTTDTNVQLSVY